MGAIFPVEMMIPYPHSKRVEFEVSTEPLASTEESVSSLVTLVLAKEIVVAQSPLRNSDWVVLEADLAVVVEQWDTGGIVCAQIIGFLGKRHVVFSEPMNVRVRICLRRLVPEGELAHPRN